MGEKLKSLVTDDRIFLSFVIVLVATASFFLGRLSVGGKVGWREGGGGVAMVPVGMTYTGSAAATGQTAKIPTRDAVSDVLVSDASTYVASRSGTKYHHRDCAGAKRIKEENRIYFTTEAEARAAGYTPAANCSQLSN